MDIFRQADLDERREAMQDALADYTSKKEGEEEQEKKNDDYNEKLQAITDPLAQELLRKPLEDLSKKVFGKASTAVRSRVSGVLRSGARQAREAVTSRLQDSASRLGVGAEDLEALRSGDPSRIAGRLISRTEGPATPSLPTGDLDDDTRTVLNRSRALRGRLSRPAQPTGDDGEPVEIDALTGRPIVRQEDNPRPQAIDEADDWTAQLYDQPITHDLDLPSRVPSTRPPISLASEPEDPTARVVSNRLNSIFKATDPSDLPTPSFRPTPRVQPATASAGDSQVLDQLAPMREALKTTESSTIPRTTALQNRQILNQYRFTDSDLRTGTGRPTAVDEAQAQATSGPATPQQPQLQGQSEPVQTTPESSAPPPRSEPPSGTGDSSVDASAGRQAGQQVERTVEQSAGRETTTLAEQALQNAGKADLALGGAEDPLADVLGLVTGIGTLLGGIFGGHHDAVSDAGALSNASTQQGVY